MPRRVEKEDRAVDPTPGPSRLERLVPAVGWIRRYSSADLRFDLTAGVTLAAFAIPESLAYASLAGLPPAAGLYAGIAAMLAFSLFGSSRQLAAGVTSALAVLTAGTVAGLADGDPQKAAPIAAFAAMVAGAAALVGWLCRLGFMANLVSRSVLVGFSAGAGIYIASTQLGKLFGVEGGEGEVLARLTTFAGNVGDTNGLTLAVGLVALALLLLARRFAPKAPAALLVVALAILIEPVLGLHERGVAVVGAIAGGFPTPSVPDASVWGAWRDIVPLGLALFVLSYVEGVSAARSLAARHGGRVDPDQEMLANGVANLTSGLFRGMAVGGSLTRSSVNVEVGAKTPLSSAVGGILMIAVVAFFTSVFRGLPETVLAAVILVAVVDLVDVRALRRIFVLSRREALIAGLTGLGVLLFGMLWGVIIGVVVSLLDLLERLAFPHVAELGRVPHTDHFVDRDIHPEYAPAKHVLVVRVDASLVFANAHEVREEVLARVRHRGAEVQLVVLDLESSPVLDLSGVDMLGRLRETLASQRIELRLAGLKADGRHLLSAAMPGVFAMKPGLDAGAVVRDFGAPRPSSA